MSGFGVFPESEKIIAAVPSGFVLTGKQEGTELLLVCRQPIQSRRIGYDMLLQYYNCAHGWL
jgi:hypothetical protein